MKEYPNFYENLKEAHIRLKGTVVLYDKEPYYVVAITNHLPDGIFRIYLDPIGNPAAMASANGENFPANMIQGESAELGPELDKWMKTPHGMTFKLLRKQMNSPLFNKFRPFPLGMVNHSNDVIFIERQPDRPRTSQGLTRSMMSGKRLSLDDSGAPNSVPDVTNASVAACIRGDYPSATDCLENLLDPLVTNRSAAFNRQFAFLRGPLQTVYIAYKDEVVGVLPHSDFSEVRIGKPFHHLREVVSELKLFDSVSLGA